MRDSNRYLLASGALAGAAMAGGCGVSEWPSGNATWQLVRPADVSADTTSLEVGVERTGCAGGKTGTVLEPDLTYEFDRIIIRAYVEPLTGDVYSCPGNDVVPLTVDLDDPVGDRELVDGACLVPNTVPATYCDEDDGVRWAVREPSTSAIWRLPKGEEVSPSSTSFRVDVTRIGCSGGVTGSVLDPKITYEKDRIVIQTEVEALPEEGYDCPSNDIVQLTMELAEPVGARRLIDGGCLAGEAVTTAFCEDYGVRTPWPPPAGS